MSTVTRQPFELSTQRRHTGAKWPLPRGLQARLSIFVALIVGTVVTALTYLEVQAFARATERDLLNTVRMTGRAVADDLGTHPGATSDEIADALHELMEANPSVRSLSIVALGDGGQAELVESTSSEETSEALDLARAALMEQSPRLDETAALARAAQPIDRAARPTAVVATVSLAGVRDAARRGRSIALWFAVPTVLLVTLLIDLVMRRQIHEPLALIRRTMERAANGELAVRAPIGRDDELGVVTGGLNDMLQRLERANAGLQDQIRDATDELRRRNIQIAESYQRTLALRETLSRTERMAAVGQVAATVAHQVGTPLNLIAGYIQMIREEWRADPQTAHRLQIVDAQIQQVTRILRTLLDEARQPSVRDVIDIGDVVAHVREIASPRLARTGVTLQVSLAEALPPIAADRVQLELALLNLVSNALDAMSGGGMLTIRALATNDGVRIEVADTGSGVPPELLTRIFDPWVTTKPVGQGTGLGLGIVREVVEAHGGHIAAANDSSGGAVFTIDLPLCPVS